MKLSQLLYKFYDTTLYTEIDITGLALDSRKVKTGDLFFACQGTQKDGRDFIDAAIQNGAHAILAEEGKQTTGFHTKNGIPIFPVQHLNQEIGPIAAQFYGNPSKKLKITGVTGTNGKTSCSFFLAQALQQLGFPCGIIGTLGSGIYGKLQDATLTTPDAITLQATLANFVEQKIKYVAMETSSHSIDQGRINSIEFAIGLFTNLTRDHLDYHQTMAAYGAAKKKLFDNPLTHQAVINADDPFGRYLLSTLSREDIFAYSLSPTTNIPQNLHSIQKKLEFLKQDFSFIVDRNSTVKPKRLLSLSDEIPFISVDEIKLTEKGIKADVNSPWGKGSFFTPLLGEFNLSNVLAVFTALCLLKIPFEEALQSLQQLSPVPGRMQAFGGQEKPLVVVDYAHTPDALEKVLSALKRHCAGKLLCLFGCGGDRDSGKRPLMAKIVETYADFIIVTDDNPRMEDPQKIVAEIMTGFTEKNKVLIQHDRSKAIQDIIHFATENDCVLIAGKGAEMYQVIGNQKFPFSDAQKVMENLA